MEAAGVFLAGFVLAVVATLVRAEDTTPGVAKAAPSPRAPIQLTDAELDQITSGDVTVTLFTPGPTNHTAGGPNNTVLIFGGGDRPAGFILTPKNLIFIGH